MKAFAVKFPDGRRQLGVGLSEAEIEGLLRGEVVSFDLGSVGVGIWAKEKDGTRQFIQPRHSNVVVIRGDTASDIGSFLNVEIPEC
jgi:hypothetical protein